MKMRILLWIIVAIIFYRQATPLFSLVRNFPLNDFSVYLDAAITTQEGKNPYSIKFFDRYNYPPAATLFFSLFTLISRNTAEFLFTTLSLLALWFTISWTLKLLRWKLRVEEHLLFFVLSWKAFPVKLTLSLGQINIIIIALLIGTFFYYKKKKSAISGFLLGLAIAFKLTPLPILIFFLMKKQWRLVAYCIIAVLTFILIGIGAYGWPLSLSYFTAVVPGLLAETGQHTLNTTYMNQSFTAFFARLGVFGRINSLLRLGISLCAFLALSFVTKNKRRMINELLFFWQFVIVSIVFLPVFVWQHHYVVFVPLLLILFYKAIKMRKKILLFVVIGNYALFNFYVSNVYWFSGKHPLLISHFLLLGVFLWIACYLLLFQQQKVRNAGNQRKS